MRGLPITHLYTSVDSNVSNLAMRLTSGESLLKLPATSSTIPLTYKFFKLSPLCALASGCVWGCAISLRWGLSLRYIFFFFKRGRASTPPRTRPRPRPCQRAARAAANGAARRSTASGSVVISRPCYTTVMSSSQSPAPPPWRSTTMSTTCPATRFSCMGPLALHWFELAQST